MLDNQNILVTGGTGSFGQKFIEIVLNKFTPRRLIVFSRDELKQYEMAQVFSPEKHKCLRYFIGDVRDKERLYRALHGVDYVIHAAAMKHVTVAEYNPTECIKTNIGGAENIINVASDLGVKKVIALSTDKAVSPINLYGATKLCSDKLFISANAYVGCRTIFSVVRYGNVMGSRGSVIPYFIKMRDTQGYLPITDASMTRFWITLEQGVNLVLQALEDARGGEVFIPKIPSMKVTDLAEAIAPGLPTRLIGIRAGEKLHEVMTTPEDAARTCDYGDYYVIYRVAPRTPGRLVVKDFVYSSDSNPQRLTIPEMQGLLKEQGFL